MLSDIAAERVYEISQYSSTSTPDSNNEADDESPVFDSFYATGRNEPIVKISNLTAPEFRKLYSILQSCTNTNWNNEHGKISYLK